MYQHWVKRRGEVAGGGALLRCFHSFPLMENWQEVGGRMGECVSVWVCMWVGGREFVWMHVCGRGGRVCVWGGKG